MKEKSLGSFQPIREIQEGADVVVYFQGGGVRRRVQGAIVKVYQCPEQPNNQIVHFRTTNPLRLMSIGGGTLARPIKTN